MRLRRVLAVVLVMVLGTTFVMPAVLAQDFQTGRRRIDLKPDPSILPNQDINLADVSDPSQVNLEKDSLSAEFLEPGRYLGPYIRSSKFSFTFETGGTFQFQSNFTFKREQIMSGASTFWVRWPIDVSDFDFYCIEIYGFYDSVNPYRRCEGTWFDVVEAGLGSQTVKDGSGLYVKDWAWLLPDREYGFKFNGTLRRGFSPSVWLTIERFQNENLTLFSFSNPLEDSSHTEEFPLYPAFAFNFIAGAGEGGLTSYSINAFDGTDANLFVYYLSLGDVPLSAQGDDYVSVYVPFFDAEKVDWKIDVRCNTFSTVFYVNNTDQFLLASTPVDLETMCPGGPFDPTQVFIDVKLVPNKALVLLGVIPDSPVPYLTIYDVICLLYPCPTFYRTQTELRLGADSDGQATGIFIEVAITNGRWASVTPGAFFTTYDFGWGRAFLFPGQVNLVMFLNNGTAVGFDSIAQIPGEQNEQCSFLSIAGFPTGIKDVLQPISEWITKLACFIFGLVGDIIGFIQTAFHALWDVIKNLGEWIYSALLSFVGFIVSVAMAIIEITTQIVFSFLAAAPFILILFIAARGLPDVFESARQTREKTTRIIERVRTRRASGIERRTERAERRTARLERRRRREEGE